jgi:hypothetical protein
MPNYLAEADWKTLLAKPQHLALKAMGNAVAEKLRAYEAANKKFLAGQSTATVDHVSKALTELDKKAKAEVKNHKTVVEVADYLKKMTVAAAKRLTEVAEAAKRIKEAEAKVKVTESQLKEAAAKLKKVDKSKLEEAEAKRNEQMAALYREELEEERKRQVEAELKAAKEKLKPVDESKRKDEAETKRKEAEAKRKQEEKRELEEIGKDLDTAEYTVVDARNFKENAREGGKLERLFSDIDEQLRDLGIREFSDKIPQFDDDNLEEKRRGIKSWLVAVRAKVGGRPRANLH